MKTCDTRSVEAALGPAWLRLGALVPLAALVISIGCSSGSSGGGGNTACLTSYAGQSCYSCVQSHCGSQLSSYQSSCADYVSCFCPGGTFSATNQSSQACQAKVVGACDTANNAIGQCAGQSCATECAALAGGSSSGASSSGASSSGASSSGASSSGASSSGGSSSGSGSTMACGVTFTSAACASCVQTSCCTETQACTSDSACAAAVACITNCGSSTTCSDACVTSASTATQTKLVNMTDCWSNTCGPSGC